ncbi:MAG: histidinol-phosphate transaminase [Nitrospirae bacterium]|nr:histidinol-phosphate transaminase [Nitrospirota bacterium]
MIRPPEYVSSIRPYVPGKPVEELERELGIKDSVKLASNENPLGPSPRALEAIQKATKDLNRYPDGGGYYLKGALAAGLAVEPENIILGNGSNELLDIAARTYMRPGEEAVMATPSFVVYAMAVRSMGCAAIEIPLKKHTHDLEAMQRAVTPNTRIVFIANPNNPTGTINRKDEFDRFMEELPEGVLVVADEAYYEYVCDPEYADSMKWFRAGKDVLILRTFSKIFGLAGLRVGYGIAKSGIITEMNKLRPPFNTNSIGQMAAQSALGDHAHIAKSRETNETGKRYICGELDRLGLQYVPTEANFIYLPVDDSGPLYEGLLKQGVIVRPMGPGALRVTIGLPEENARFVAALETVLG